MRKPARAMKPLTLLSNQTAVVASNVIVRGLRWARLLVVGRTNLYGFTRCAKLVGT